jgi:hypothetical protein
MLKAEAAEKLSCWPKITSAAKSHEQKQSTYRSAEVLRHPKAAATRVRFKSVAASVVRKLFPRTRLESSLLISREGLDTIQELAQDASKLFRLLPRGIVPSFGDDSHLAAWNVLAH